MNGERASPVGRDDVLTVISRRIEVLDGVGHFGHVEAPERVARLTLEFLAPLQAALRPPAG